MLPSIALLALLAQTNASEASALVDAGVALSNRGQFNEAGEKFVRALALDPNLEEAHYLLGLVRQQGGRADAALESFLAAVRIRPSYAEAQARVCELRTVTARARDLGFEEAKADCSRAVALAPADPEPHFHLGWLQAKLGNYPKAIEEHRTTLRLNPKFPRVKFELAMAYLDANQPERAVPLLKQVVAAEPQNGNARYQLGAALAKSGDCAAAIPLLETATASAPTQYVLAGCYKKMNRSAEAATAMVNVRKAREGADARMQAKYRAAAANNYAEAGKLDEAIGEYRAALDLVKDSSVAIDLAVALLRKGDSQEVLNLLRDERSPLARYQVALAHFQLGQYRDAISTLQSIVKMKPEFAEAWYQLGLSSLQTGSAVDAERAFAKAVGLRPDEPALRRAWAEALTKIGKLEEAREQSALAK